VPAADEIERRTFLITLQILKDAIGEQDDGSPRVIEGRFQCARKQLLDYSESVDLRIRRYQRRKEAFRAELEKYFEG
jgi:hypothetical protein